MSVHTAAATVLRGLWRLLLHALGATADCMHHAKAAARQRAAHPVCVHLQLVVSQARKQLEQPGVAEHLRCWAPALQRSTRSTRTKAASQRFNRLECPPSTNHSPYWIAIFPEAPPAVPLHPASDICGQQSLPARPAAPTHGAPPCGTHTPSQRVSRTLWGPSDPAASIMQARASCGLGSRPTGLARRSATAPLRGEGKGRHRDNKIARWRGERAGGAWSGSGGRKHRSRAEHGAALPYRALLRHDKTRLRLM